MFELFEEQFGRVNKAESFYCGDAAGRPATSEKDQDFSDGDLQFARSCGLKFETPESLFLFVPSLN